MAKRICVLEDDEDIRMIIELLLQEENYEVSGFASVSDFIKGNMGSKPDLFLLDVMLPDGNGIAVCEMLKKEKNTRHIPVLMMSAHSNSEVIKQSCSSEGFVAKPFNIDEFVVKVQSSLKAS